MLMLKQRADDYFRNRVHSHQWFENDHEERGRALSTAQDAINNLVFVENVDTANNWDIQRAIFEEAFERIKGRDPQKEYEKLFKKSEGYASIRVTYDRMHAPEHVAVGIVSTVAWLYLKPYLDRAGSVILYRVD